MATLSSAHAAVAGNNPLLRIVAAISTVSGWCAAAMIVVAVGITCQMIFVRFVLNGSTYWQTEAVVFLMIGATLIGLPYVQRMRGHVNVDLVPLMLPMPVRRALAVLTLAVSIAIIGIMLYYACETWHLAFERGWRSQSVWGPRLWVPYLALPLGLGLLLLQLVADLIAVILRIDTPFGLEDH